MSQENVDTLRAVYDEWGRGNFRAGGELFDAHTVCVVDQESPEPGRYVGPAEIAAWIAYGPKRREESASSISALPSAICR